MTDLFIFNLLHRLSQPVNFNHAGPLAHYIHAVAKTNHAISSGEKSGVAILGWP